MNRIYSLQLICSLFIVSFVSAQSFTSYPATQNSTGAIAKAGNNNFSADWYHAAVNNIKPIEASFRAQSAAGCYSVASRSTGFYISPSGYAVNGNEQSAWNVAFTIKGIGRKTIQWQPGSNYHIDQHQNELTYRFNNVQVQYINNSDGLRQNFIVNKKMPGSGALTVTIKPTTRLTARSLSNNSIAFYTTGNHVALSYEDLKVWDASQQQLPATMSLVNGAITITVNDAKAVYPITIDPINKTPLWNTSMDGLLTNVSSAQVNAALYGYTVTSVGDVNGDGYGDAAISAPALADVFTGTGSLASVGAVFVFYGSQSGLSTTPAKPLQPATAAAGALFGFSVDGGDVNGDGFSDIIVGAPLDSYTTTASGLLGPVSATVKAGKVYIFPGGTSSTANPTNFVEVKLQGTGFFSTGILNVLASNVSVNALFGFSVAVTNDLNGDHKADLVVGSPAYVGTSLTDIQNGAAFVYYSNNLTTTSPVQLAVPTASLLGLISLPTNTSGLLYGFSVDGIGDYNNDGHPDVVVGAPAGIDLSSLGGVLTGQILSGSAYVYYGTGSGINSSIGAKLQPSAAGLLGNAANLFGYKVKGLKDANGNRNGSIAIGAPLGGLLPNTLGLTVQTGNVHIFKKKSSSPSAAVTSDQVLESPRSTSLLQVLNTLNLNVLFGASIDNGYDLNCDGVADLVVGEPLSSGATLAQLQANAVGGSVYAYLGDGSGAFVSTPNYNVVSSYGSQFLSVNAVSLFGYSVAVLPNASGVGSTPTIMAGAPAGALDFNNGLLNLGSTLGLITNFVAGDNGPGKSFLFDPHLCLASSSLPVTLVDFSGQQQNSNINLQWKTAQEQNMNYYELQRSHNGTAFETIAMVFPWDDNSRTDYAYLDKTVTPGTNYYRLKMVDKNGSYEYSRTITFTTGNIAGTSIAVMPNPVTSYLRIQFNNVNPGNYNVEVRNTLGQLFLQKSVNVTQYGQTENLMRPVSMTPGIYFLNFYEKNSRKVTSYKVIVI